MIRRRRLYLVASLALTAAAACTLSPLNPQPLPPGTDNEAAFGDGGSFATADGGAASGDSVNPPSRTNDASVVGHEDDGGASGDASPQPPPADGGDDAATDAGPDADAGAT